MLDLESPTAVTSIILIPKIGLHLCRLTQDVTKRSQAKIEVVFDDYPGKPDENVQEPPWEVRQGVTGGGYAAFEVDAR